MTKILNDPEVKPLLSDEHFSVEQAYDRSGKPAPSPSKEYKVDLTVVSPSGVKADAGFLLFHFPLPAGAPDDAKWAREFRTIGQAWLIGVEI